MPATLSLSARLGGALLLSAAAAWAPSALAQSIPSTVGCTPSHISSGAFDGAPGWSVSAGSPHCSTTTYWANYTSLPWEPGPVPTPPSGTNTFLGIYSTEGMKATMTGLTPGSVYTVYMYVHTSDSSAGGSMCPNGADSFQFQVDGVPLMVSIAGLNVWERKSVTFTAQGTTAEFNVTGTVPSGCFVNLEISGADIGQDTDSDGLADDDEGTYGTDPNDPDSDGDGTNDGDEVNAGTNPLQGSNVCGDGSVDGPEACDDGNTLGGDGCSATCTVEVGFVCSGAPSMCCLSGVSSQFALVGDAAFDSATGELIITPALNDQAGALWLTEQVDLVRDFRLDLDLHFGANDAGADGFTMLLQRDPQGLQAIGGLGIGLAANGLTPSAGFELDTYQNGGDPAYDHTHFFANSVVPGTPLDTVRIVDGKDDVEDGAWYRAALTWTASSQTLALTIDGQTRVSRVGDLTNDVFGGISGGLYLGATGGTGSANNLQKMCIRRLALPQDSDRDTVIDSSDTDDDNDGIPDASELGGVDLSGDGNGNGIPDWREVAALAEVGVSCDDAAPQDGICDAVPSAIDPDGDGLPGHLDPDDDNDGIPTAEEIANGIDADRDADGVPDHLDAVHDAPADPTADVGYANEGGSVLVSVLANDGERPAGIVPVIVHPPEHGTATVQADGRIEYVHDGSETTSDGFTYALSDGIATSGAASVAVEVTPVNDAPVAVDDAVTLPEGGSAVLGLVGNDKDPESEVLRVVSAGTALHGTVSVVDGVVTYVHDGSETTTDTFTYVAFDGEQHGFRQAATIK